MTEEIVLFGAGSPLIVEIQESCYRRGLSIAAVIQNTPEPPHPSAVAQSVALADVPPEFFELSMLIPLFTPANRQAACLQATGLGAKRFAPLLDPTSIMPSRIAIERGVYVNAGCVFGACSRLGPFALVNRGCSLGHHLDLGAFASIGPGVVIGGNVTIGDGAMIGAGAVILPKVRIGEGAVVTAGTVVRHDVAAGIRISSLGPATVRERYIAHSGAADLTESV